MKQIHIGFIPDGNRRWARQHGYTPQTVLPVLMTRWFQNLCSTLERLQTDPAFQSIHALSLYMLSRDNLEKRTTDGTLYMIYQVLEYMYWCISGVHVLRTLSFHLHPDPPPLHARLYLPLSLYSPGKHEPPSPLNARTLLRMIFGVPVSVHLDPAWSERVSPLWKQCVQESRPEDPSNALQLTILSSDEDIRFEASSEELLNRVRHHVDVLRRVYERCQIRFIGERERLPPEVQAQCRALEEVTQEVSSSLSTSPLLLQFAIAYDPIEDIRREVNAPRRRPDIDLVIRTSGELRSSGFLPLDTLYSEWIYEPKLFPDFRLEDLQNALRVFQSRERRFGR